MIAKAEEIIKIWEDGLFAGSREDAMDKAVQELEAAVKKVRGEV